AYNLRQSHPRSPGRPLIDFELAALLGPALMAGGQVGSLLHDVVPTVLILFLLCIVLGHSAWKGLVSARRISARERHANMILFPVAAGASFTGQELVPRSAASSIGGRDPVDSAPSEVSTRRVRS
ncbi:unnamed protein product, partial [Polarella glacialis]